MRKVERILIFELNWLGDILFSFPFLRAIRKKFPDAYIACVVVPQYVDLLVNNPWINDVHALSNENRLLSLGDKLAFIRMIRKEKYDTCFLLKPSGTKAVIAALAGIGERIGFSGKNASLTEEVEMPTGQIHRADQILALAGAAGVESADGSYEYFVSMEDEERADTLLHEVGGGVGRIVALNPGGNWGPKRWIPENFIQLAKKILDRFKDVEIMIPGSEKDTELTQRIISEVASSRCYTVAGKTGINELACLLKKCTLVISADSGPLHLASATGVTTIGLFGPTSYKITGPRGRGKNIIMAKSMDCEVPCYVKECDKDYYCMKSISVDDVFKAAKEILTEG